MQKFKRIYTCTYLSAMPIILVVALMACELRGQPITYQYVCTNGTAVSGDVSVDGIENCSSCNGGFPVINGKCNHYYVSEFDAGSYHTCAVLNDNSAKCWGENMNGHLGQGNTNDIGRNSTDEIVNIPAIDLGSNTSALKVIAGHLHTCALLSDNSVKCWGLNGRGQLGQGHTSNMGDDANEMGDNLPAIDLGSGKTALQVATGQTHTCALLNDNSVKCWGYNARGQLGQGHISNIGDDANEMGDNLPAIDLGSGKTALQVATGTAHTCALLNDNSVKCWGYSGQGRLGQGTSTTIGDDANEMGDNLPAIDLGSGKTALQITAGGSHTCALLNDNSVKCWGDGDNGRLGQGNGAHIGDDANEMGDNLPAIDLGSDMHAVQIIASSSHTCARLNDNSVKCWGVGASGRLGSGNTNYIGDDANEMGDNLSAIDLGSGRKAVQIRSAGHHTCALLDDNTLKCWGRGGSGQLGQGHNSNLGDQANEMGDNLPPIYLGYSDN